MKCDCLLCLSCSAYKDNAGDLSHIIDSSCSAYKDNAGDLSHIVDSSLVAFGSAIVLCGSKRQMAFEGQFLLTGATLLG